MANRVTDVSSTASHGRSAEEYDGMLGEVKNTSGPCCFSLETGGLRYNEAHIALYFASGSP